MTLARIRAAAVLAGVVGALVALMAWQPRVMLLCAGATCAALLATEAAEAVGGRPDGGNPGRGGGNA